MEWTWDGHTFGTGTDDNVQMVDLGAHDLRPTRVLLPQNHGGVSGDDWAGMRTVQLDLLIQRSTIAAAEDAFDSWHGRMQPTSTDQELTFVRADGTTRTFFCRPEAPRVRWDQDAKGFSARLRWEAADPAMYGPAVQTQVEPYALSGGLSYPVTYPKVYGSAGSGGGVTVSNGGNWPSWPKFTIAGPTTGSVNVLAIEDATNGESIEFTADGGLTVSSGSTLVVDTHPARRVVQFTSGADRLSTVVDLDSWFSIPAGDSEIRFRASGTTAGATLTTELRSAWL